MNNQIPSAGLAIRPASYNDIPFIRDIANKTWPAAYEALLGRDQLTYMLDKLYSPSALEDQMKKHHYFFLALREYAPVGFASFSNLEKDIYKLQKLYVLPSEQKSGLGRTLLETVETVSKSMGATKLQLNVNRKNIAKGFYEKQGFFVIKQEDIDIGSGYYMNDYVMEKDL
ncbi:GNAT family N-acetyltransferase [Segetibacter aerophilus]|uniref:N-acetyltransferase n=1 Tax=Segetibacter aerophilus TaxID=670293 RepID=A0A512BA11_9BACT|nr:GNAT family N-acetyltransferase [Segetibacter aerophilus]GEO08811.1 N-acetyltransferase [Segetibacter aerophilus]